MVADVQLHAMGCQARVVVNGADHDRLAAWAVERVEQLEACWSRFRPTSEITRLNNSQGRPTVVSADTFALIERAVEAWRATAGRFDPTMLGELVGHGYDRSHFDLQPAAGPPGPATNEGDGASPRISRCREIELVPGLLAVTLPAGVSLDPGGIGKGLAADMVATELMAKGAKGAMVDLGGDIRVVGDHPDHGPTWTVIVDDPRTLGADRFRVGLADSGIATSSQLQRRWATGAGDRHHLLDPRTGDPSTSPVAAAVVATGEAWWGEVIAKAALTAGFEDGSRLIAENQAVGVLFDFDGEDHDVGLLAAVAVV